MSKTKVIFLYANKANRYLQNIFLLACGATIANGVTSLIARNYVASPQAKDIHQVMQVKITTATGKEIVLTNGDIGFQSIGQDAEIRPILKNTRAVAEETKKIINARQSTDLAAVSVDTGDIADGDNYQFTLPNGRGTTVKDKDGRNIPVPSMTLGNASLAYQAVGYIERQQSLSEEFDQTAKMPGSANGLIWRQVSDAFYSVKLVKTIYDHMPEIR